MDKSNKSFTKSIYLTLLAMGLYAVVFGLATYTLFSAKGEANKIFIPFEATSALSSLGAAKEMLDFIKQKFNY